MTAPVSGSRAIVPLAKNPSMALLEEEDRLVISSIANKFQQLDERTIFSSKTLPSRILLKFFHLRSVGIEDLRRINISTNRIKQIKVQLAAGLVSVELERKASSRKARPNIRKRRRLEEGPNKAMIDAAVENFLTKHSTDVRDSDERVVRAALGCILRWTWNKAATEVECKRHGDRYGFCIRRLQTVGLRQMEELCDLGEYVQGLTVDLKAKVVRFFVLRTAAYIEDSEGLAKRRKVDN